MELFDSEEQQFFKIYNRIRNKNSGGFHQAFCMKLMTARGGLSPYTADLVWNIVSENSTLVLLDQKHFYMLMRYVAGIQNGLEIKSINPNKIELENNALYDSTGVDHDSEVSLGEENSDSGVFLKGVKVEISKLVENPYESGDRKLAETNVIKEEEIFQTFETNERSPEKGKADCQDHFEEANHSQILSRNEQVHAEAFFTFHGDQMLREVTGSPKREEKKESEISGIGDSLMGFSDPRDNNQSMMKNNLDVSIMRRPINCGNDKVTVSMHIFSNVIEMESKTKESNRTIKETEIIEYFIKENSYLDRPTYYRIRTRLFFKEEPFMVERRYSDFEWLATYFRAQAQYQGLILPRLPEKHSITGRINNILRFDSDFINKRQKELEQYLQELITSERFCEDRTLFGFLTMSEKEWKELKEKGNDKASYWGKLSTISPFNLIDNYNYMKSYLAIKCNQTIFKLKRSYELKEIEPLYASFRDKQKFLQKLKDSLFNLEYLRNNSMACFLANFSETHEKRPGPDHYSNDLEMKAFPSIDHWENFLGHCAKNEQSFAPNVEDSYFKILKDIIYKIEMSTIVYENILEEIDEYELKVKIRETGKDNSIEAEIQNRKEKIRVMEQNFLGNLKQLNVKVDENLIEICKGIEEKGREYWRNYLDNLRSYPIF